MDHIYLYTQENTPNVNFNYFEILNLISPKIFVELKDLKITKNYLHFNNDSFLQLKVSMM